MIEDPRPYVVTSNRHRTGGGDVSWIRAREALDEIRTWPGYRITPLHELPGLASAIGVSAVWLKDESSRFGVGSFKPMGAGYAVTRTIARHIERETGRPKVTSAQILVGTFRDVIEELTVACATDGNHGRAVAWAARQFGCAAVVYLAGHVSAYREEAIASHGAEVIRTAGNHDEAVLRMARDARRRGWHVISESASASDPAIAQDIVSGYGALVLETVNQLEPERRPTHVFVQAGVGGLAAASVAVMQSISQAIEPRIVIVEARNADSIRRSIEAGDPVAVTGHLETVMGGLSAGVVSPGAWPILRNGAFAVIALDDDPVGPALTALARGNGDPPLEIGESGVAGIAALMAVADDPEARLALELTESSRVLTIATEGVTDPAVFQRLVGRAPSAPDEFPVS